MICLFASILTGNGGTQTNKVPGEVWWSLKPVVRLPLPDGPESNPIDRFINVELNHRGLKGVGAADKPVLLRRVYLDLIGIPPSPAEQEAFLEDNSADAYEKVVDQLLANEQHAVRSEEHTSELQSLTNLVCRLLLEKKKTNTSSHPPTVIMK